MSSSNASDLRSLLSQWRIRISDEKHMQSDIAEVLAESGLTFEREYRLSPKDTIDFLVGGVGIECKVAGSRTEVLRQLLRYMDFDAVHELLLVSTKASHKSIDGMLLRGKPVVVYGVKCF